jgi:hypothetical protein
MDPPVFCYEQLPRRRLHNEELHKLYVSPNVIRVIKSRKLRWLGQVAQMGEMKNLYKFLVWKPEGKGLLGRPRHRSGNNIRMDLNKRDRVGDVDWIHLALVNTVMNLGVP